jgi:hypothetical protein
MENNNFLCAVLPVYKLLVRQDVSRFSRRINPFRQSSDGNKFSGHKISRRHMFRRGDPSVSTVLHVHFICKV